MWQEKNGENPKAAELQMLLKDAADAFTSRQYNLTVLKYRAALDHILESNINNQCVDVDANIIQYLLSIALLKSDNLEDFMEAIQILNNLEKSIGPSFPAVYYALGKAYCELFRFELARDVIRKGFASLSKDAKLEEHYIPGTDLILPETERIELMIKLIRLNDKCSGWRQPDAVCRFDQCLDYSNHFAPSQHIFFRDPAFTGLVEINCNNTLYPCIIKYHRSCWELKKEHLTPDKKLSDEEFLGHLCVTPNCKNDNGENSTIIKIKITGKDGNIEAVYETPIPVSIRTDQQITSKGAIKKKSVNNDSNSLSKCDLQNTSENQNDAANNLTENQMKLQKLIELRKNNFGIPKENDWRPDQRMYGNNRKLESLNRCKSPCFEDGNPETSNLRSMIFTLLYNHIRIAGSIKKEELLKMWKDTRSLVDKSDSIFDNTTDIAEFLLQSPRISCIGDYFCIPEEIPEAYNSAKRDIVGCLEYLTKNQIDPGEIDIQDDDIFNQIISDTGCNKSVKVEKIQEDAAFLSDSPSEALWKKYLNLESVHSNVNALDNKEQNNVIFSAGNSNINKVQVDSNPKESDRRILIRIAPLEKLLKDSGGFQKNDAGFQNQSKISYKQPNVYKKFKHQQPFDKYLKYKSRSRGGLKKNKVPQVLLQVPIDALMANLKVNPTISETDYNDLKRKYRELESEMEILKKKNMDMESKVKELMAEKVAITQSFERERNNLKQENLTLAFNLKKEASVRSELVQSDFLNVKKRWFKQFLNTLYVAEENHINTKLDQSRVTLDALNKVMYLVESNTPYRISTDSDRWQKLMDHFQTLSAQLQEKYAKYLSFLEQKQFLEVVEDIHLGFGVMPLLPNSHLLHVIQEGFHSYFMHYGRAQKVNDMQPYIYQPTQCPLPSPQLPLTSEPLLSLQPPLPPQPPHSPPPPPLKNPYMSQYNVTCETSAPQYPVTQGMQKNGSYQIPQQNHARATEEVPVTQIPVPQQTIENASYKVPGKASIPTAINQKGSLQSTSKQNVNATARNSLENGINQEYLCTKK
ncbi:uncharacterized protein LOC105702570 isoform X2 [Orussus abietinus]|uniref:uncharacterized protein LOC105702570 isoform X2 n=1 Tax=Orussus abietinus TaxID=222816 RepID=UPI000625684A|nr:uncharacterized protein LOC105702570 isoform X2 [Orussus abietinus]